MSRCCFGVTGPLVTLRAGAAVVTAKASYPGFLLFASQLQWCVLDLRLSSDIQSSESIPSCTAEMKVKLLQES